MINQTYEKLLSLKLHKMAEIYKEQCNSQAFKELSFDERLAFVNVNIKFTKSVSLIFTSSGCYDHHPQSWISYPLFDMTFL